MLKILVVSRQTIAWGLSFYFEVISLTFKGISEF